jgi:hypothetical protein
LSSALPANLQRPHLLRAIVVILVAHTIFYRQGNGGRSKPSELYQQLEQSTAKHDENRYFEELVMLYCGRLLNIEF